jgi:hypothetical protein
VHPPLSKYSSSSDWTGGTDPTRSRGWTARKRPRRVVSDPVGGTRAARSEAESRVHRPARYKQTVRYWWQPVQASRRCRRLAGERESRAIPKSRWVTPRLGFARIGSIFSRHPPPLTPRQLTRFQPNRGSRSCWPASSSGAGPGSLALSFIEAVVGKPREYLLVPRGDHHYTLSS